VVHQLLQTSNQALMGEESLDRMHEPQFIRSCWRSFRHIRAYFAFEIPCFVLDDAAPRSSRTASGSGGDVSRGVMSYLRQHRSWIPRCAAGLNNSGSQADQPPSCFKFPGSAHINRTPFIILSCYLDSAIHRLTSFDLFP